MYQYAIKFVCGDNKEELIVAPGRYWTAINVHNPRKERIKFEKIFSIALPHEKAGPVSRPFTAELKAYESLEIDNEDIIQHTQDIFEERFRKGFAVIQSDTELDIVAVYTATTFNREDITMHTERVLPRTL